MDGFDLCLIYMTQYDNYCVNYAIVAEAFLFLLCTGLKLKAVTFVGQ